MGRQIGILQTKEDEQLIKDWLNKRAGWLSLPRLFKDADLRPVSLEEGSALEEVVFLSESVAEVIGNIQPLSNDVNTYQVYPRDGLCFDWEKSMLSDDGLGYTRGRFYYGSCNSGWPEFVIQITKHFTALQAYVKETYPMMTLGKNPVYIGPTLSYRIAHGLSSHSWKSGKPIEIVANPRFRG
jgi:hypothetical protein